MGDPSPVTGSHPAFAGNPCVPHPGLLPTTNIRQKPLRKILEKRLTSSDIVERLGVGVQPGVQEAKGALARSEEPVVDQGDDGGEDRGRAGRAANALGAAVDDDLDVLALSGDVGVGTAGAVEEACVGRAEQSEVVGNGGGFCVGRSVSRYGY